MLNALVVYIRSLFAEAQHDELLIPVRVEEKRAPWKKR